MFAALVKGADVAIGSRWLDPQLQIQKQPLHRQLFGRIFNLALRIVLGLKFTDTQCGFKAFARRGAHSIFALQRIARWGFDPELLYLARKFAFVVPEVPVVWTHREGTRINPLRRRPHVWGNAEDPLVRPKGELRLRWHCLQTPPSRRNFGKCRAEHGGKQW